LVYLSRKEVRLNDCSYLTGKKNNTTEITILVLINILFLATYNNHFVLWPYLRIIHNIAFSFVVYNILLPLSSGHLIGCHSYHDKAESGIVLSICIGIFFKGGLN